MPGLSLASETYRSDIPTESKGIGEKCLSASFAMFFCSNPILLVSKTLCGWLGFGDPFVLTTIIIYCPYCIFLLSCVREDIPFYGTSYLFVFTGIVALIIVSSFFHPEYSSKLFDRSFYYNVFDSILSPLSAPYAFLFVVSCINGDRLMKNIYYAAAFSFAYNMARFAFAQHRGFWNALSYSGDMVERGYSLEFGFDMLFVCVVFLFFYLWKNRKRDLFICLIGAFAIAVGGGRAALVYLVLAVPLTMLFFYKRYKKQLVICATALVVAGLFLSDIADVLATILAQFDISSRTLDSMLAGNFTDGNGREEIYGMAIDMLSNSDPFGYGLYGDRYVIGQRFYWGFPHNLALESMITFGIVPAIMLGMIWVYAIVVSFRRARGDSELKCSLMIFLLCCMQLLTSLSYWYSLAFWASLGTLSLMRRARFSNQYGRCLRYGEVGEADSKPC